MSSSSPVYRRLRAIDLGLAVVVFGAALAVRLSLVEVVEIGSDSADPLRGAMSILNGERSPLRSRLPFGYSRDLSYLPLLTFRAGGLDALVLARVVVQASIAPMVFLAGRTMQGGSLFSSSLCGLAAALSPGLLRTLVSGHEGYFAVEFVALALLLIATSRGGNLWLFFAGVALGFAIGNHPMACAALPAAFVLSHQLGAQTSKPATSVSLLGLGLALSLAPVVWVALPQLSAGLLGSWRATAPSNGPGPLATALAWLDGRAPWEPLILCASVLLVGLCASSRGARRLAWGSLLGVAALPVLTLAAGFAGPHNWRPLLPVLLVALGRAGGTRRAGWGIGVLLASLCVAGGWAHHGGANRGADQLAHVGRATALAEQLRRVGPANLVGYVDMPPGSGGDFLGVGLELALRRDGSALILDRDEMESGRTLVYVEAEPESIERIRGATARRGCPVILSGPRFLVFDCANAAAARDLGEVVCATGSQLVQPVASHDALSILAAQSRWISDVSPAQARCPPRVETDLPGMDSQGARLRR